MMALTHAAICIAGTSLFIGEISPMGITLSIVGSQLPDLDTTKSMMGRMCYPIAAFIEQRYSHRTITHSLLATGAIALVSLPLAYYFSIKIWLCLPLGHLLSCFSDTFTKEGVGLFYPSPARAIYGNNPNFRLRTGSTIEYWILAGAIALSIWLINLQSSGGLMISFNHLLGVKDGIEQVYNRYGSDRHIWVNVKGNKVSDRSSIDSRFFLVAQEGTNFIIQDRDGIYKTDEQITVARITADTGRTATTRERSLTFNDDEIAPILQSLDDGSAIYLTGKLEIDEPEDITATGPPDEYPTFTRAGTSIALSYCPLEVAIELLRGQFAVGTLTARTITPAPNL
jgi:inner membrane protein